MLVFCAIAALVYIPAVLTGEQGALQQVGHIQSTDQFPGDPWDVINVNGPFAVTPAWEAHSTNLSGTADLHLLIGANGGTSNAYQIATAEGIDLSLDETGIYHGAVGTNDAFVVGPPIFDLNGSCCAAYEGVVENGQLLTALTFPGSNTEEVAIPVDPPYTATSTNLGTGPRLSAWYENSKNRVVASTYNTSLNQVQVFARTPPGAFMPVTAIGMDSVFANTHWGQASSPDAGKIFIVGRNGGPVNVTQIDTITGNQDWVHQIDFVPTSPSGFVYQQCCYAQGVDLPGGGSGDGLACVSPSDTEVDICLVAPVGGSSPPQYSQCVSFPGAVTDRQAFSCDGPIITYHRPDPDLTGVLTSVINCNGLEAPCTSITEEDNSRNIVFSAFPPDTLHVQGASFPLITDQTILLEGTGTNSVNVQTIRLPMSFFNNETGDLSQYPVVVGGSLESP